MDAAKKVQELLYVNLFKEAYADFPVGEIDGTGETPDIIVRSPEHTLGIEVTRLFRDVEPNKPPLQQRESELRRITQHARQQYERLNLPPIIVGVSFSPNHQFRRNDLARTAASLLEIVTRNIPDNEGQSEEEYTWDNRHYFSETIHHVRVVRGSWITSNSWSPSEAAWSPNHGPELIQSRLGCKGKQICAMQAEVRRGMASGSERN